MSGSMVYIMLSLFSVFPRVFVCRSPFNRCWACSVLKPRHVMGIEFGERQ